MYIPKYYLAIKAKIKVNAFPTSEHAIFVQTMTPRGRLGHIGRGVGALGVQNKNEQRKMMFFKSGLLNNSYFYENIIMQFTYEFVCIIISWMSLEPQVGTRFCKRIYQEQSFNFFLLKFISSKSFHLCTFDSRLYQSLSHGDIYIKKKKKKTFQLL